MKKTLVAILAIAMLMVLCLPVMAASSFVGSAENKNAPVVTEATQNGTAVNTTTFAYSNRDGASDTVKANLNGAFTSIKNGSLDEKVGGTVACDNIFFVQSEANVNVTNPLNVTLATSYDEKPTVAVYDKDGNWTVVAAEDVTLNADGTLTLKLTKLGTVALMSVNPASDEAPTKGAYVVLWVCVGVLCAAFVVCFVVLYVQRRKQK